MLTNPTHGSWWVSIRKLAFVLLETLQSQFHECSFLTLELTFEYIVVSIGLRFFSTVAFSRFLIICCHVTNSRSLLMKTVRYRTKAHEKSETPLRLHFKPSITIEIFVVVSKVDSLVYDAICGLGFVVGSLPCSLKCFSWRALQSIPLHKN